MVEANQSGCLFVGEGVVLKGNFAVPDIASVSGVVEGDLSAKQVIVESTGLIRGKVTAESGDIRGEVAEQLTARDALTAHMRDELGITEELRARPVQAALADATTKRAQRTPAQWPPWPAIGATTKPKSATRPRPRRPTPQCPGPAQ